MSDVLNDKAVAGLPGLVSAYVPQSHSLQFVCAYAVVPLIGVIF